MVERGSGRRMGGGAGLPRVKVCGLTRAADVDAALAAGADALGFVSHPGSPRDLDPDTAAGLVERLPAGVLGVAVVVARDPDGARALLSLTGLGAVQLCGDQRAGEWVGFEWPVLRRLGVAEDASDELEAWREVALGFVLDHPSAPGGTGRGVDAARAAALAARAPCLLAGGLSPTNVAAAVAAVRPAGVDASSGLEARPGHKDPELVRAFVAAARAALERSPSL